MKKAEFLTELRKKLSGLSQDDIEDRLAFYDEMIDEYVENGTPEEVAIAGIGSVDSIVAQVVSEIPLTKLVKEKVTPGKKDKTGWIVFWVLTFPIWLPLLITAFALGLTFQIILWVFVICLFAMGIAFFVSAIAGFLGVIPWILMNSISGAVFMIGAGIASAGLSLLTFVLGILLAKGVVKLMESIFLGIKSLFVGKEERQNG